MKVSKSGMIQCPNCLWYTSDIFWHLDHCPEPELTRLQKVWMLYQKIARKIWRA